MVDLSALGSVPNNVAVWGFHDRYRFCNLAGTLFPLCFSCLRFTPCYDAFKTGHMCAIPRSSPWSLFSSSFLSLSFTFSFTFSFSFPLYFFPPFSPSFSSSSRSFISFPFLPQHAVRGSRWTSPGASLFAFPRVFDGDYL